ncbi:hypothetical protein [Duganella sp. BuS-21]|uniref:hypothetical protein n=1 Tax=Duganella sp. BuS-21 TaxID=2943848 RepID=UPI0035A62599
MFNLKHLVHENMADLISAYELHATEISENEVLLQSQTYFIDVIAEKDGVSMVYFDTSSKPANGYNVFLFLFSKRRSSLVFLKNALPSGTFTEFVDAQLGLLAQHLRSAARDILAGERGWMKEYSWPTVRPDENLLKTAESQRALKSEGTTLSVR